MSEVTNKPKDQDTPNGEYELTCTCVPDPFNSLPPELRPKPVSKKNGLREVICLGCGKKLMTNRSTDWCFDCDNGE